MKEQFIEKRFSSQSVHLLKVVESILVKYVRQGLDLSVRQLYYQLIATAYDQLPDSWIDPETGSKNNQKSYKKVVDLVNNGRLAGLLDWDVLKDRGRVPDRLAMWDDPADRLIWAARTYRLDKWEEQPNYVWVMVEKQALEGVMIPICRQVEVPFIANKGYSSASAMYAIGKELHSQWLNGKELHVIYLGDHDPSGLDMTNDVRNRLEMFAETSVEVHRLALNFDQVQQYSPPPNPAKETDSRYAAYRSEWGDECWELDALTPEVLRNLLLSAVLELRDEEMWNEATEKQEAERQQLLELAERIRSGKIDLGNLPGSTNGKKSKKK